MWIVSAPIAGQTVCLRQFDHKRRFVEWKQRNLLSFEVLGTDEDPIQIRAVRAVQESVIVQSPDSRVQEITITAAAQTFQERNRSRP